MRRWESRLPLFSCEGAKHSSISTRTVQCSLLCFLCLLLPCHSVFFRVLYNMDSVSLTVRVQHWQTTTTTNHTSTHTTLEMLPLPFGCFALLACWVLPATCWLEMTFSLVEQVMHCWDQVCDWSPEHRSSKGALRSDCSLKKQPPPRTDVLNRLFVACFLFTCGEWLPTG